MLDLIYIGVTILFFLIALAYVRTDLAKPGTALDIEIFGERRPAKVGSEPLYDPTNARLRM